MTDPDAVRRCYREILGRVPGDEELEGQMRWMDLHDVSIEDLPYILKRSDEYARLRETQTRTHRTHMGYTFTLNPADRVQLDAYERLARYEPATTTILTRILAPGTRVLNIGANIGYFAVIISGMVGPSGEVLAFEPFPPTVDILRENIRQNHASNIRVIPKAVSDASGTATMHVAPSIVHNYLSETHDSGLERITVESISIDDYAARHGIEAGFVLMDAEGSEKRILDGMTGTIRRNPNMDIISEYNPHALGIAGTGCSEFIDTCKNLGFSIYEIDESRHAVRPVSVERLLDYKPDEFTNLYLTHKAPSLLRESGILA